MSPTSYDLQQESLQVGVVQCYGGFADVSKGEYFGRRVAVKHLRFGTRDPSNRIFKVLDFLAHPGFPHDSHHQQRFCREIITWKRLSHPNILPLLGISFSMEPCFFRMVSPWMKNGSIVEYARSNPGVNRLQLVSPLAAFMRIPLLAFQPATTVVWGHVWCELPPRTRGRSR